MTQRKGKKKPLTTKRVMARVKGHSSRQRKRKRNLGVSTAAKRARRRGS